MRGTACITALCALGLTAAPAAADLPPDRYVVTLPTTAFRDLAVDPARSRVFVSDGSPTVLVRDRLGKAAALLTGLDGASGLALSADHGTLYVALSEADAIAAVDAETLTEVARYGTGAGTCPATVAEAGGRVWFGYGCAGGLARVGVLDLTGPAPAVTHDRTSTAYWAPPTVAAARGRLLVGGRTLTSYALTSYAVSGTTLTATGSADAGAALHDVALTADAAHAVTATAADDAARRRDAGSLAAGPAYGPGTHPTAVAVSGGYVATGATSGGATLRVHDAGGALVRTDELGGPLVPGSLAFAAGGAVLYAVTGAGDAPRELHVLRYPTKLVTTMSLTPPATAPRIGDVYGVGGALASATALPAGSTVYVTRASTASATYLPEVGVAPGGTFGVTDLVTRRGTYTYTATYYGDRTHAPVERSVAVTVRGYVPDLAVTTDQASYGYGDTARVTARLGVTYANRSVTITAQPLDGGETTLASGRVDARGVLTASYVMRQRTTFRARFGGDALYDPRVVARAATAGVVVRERLAGQYASAAGTHYFTTTARPVLKVGVHPSRPGSCVTARLQKYAGGAWQTVAYHGCVPLAWDSTASFRFDGPFLRAVRYRVRAAFAGDAHHAATTGSWLALAFT